MQVTKSNQAYICDLGVAKLQYHMRSQHTSHGDGAGTIPYKAPEMFRAYRRSTPADIYSLGCVMIELFTEQHVWGDLDGSQITAKVLGTYDQPPPQQPSCLELPERLQDICLKTTRMIPAERPTASDVLITLQSLL